MKRLVGNVVSFVKKEWFLFVMLSTITVIFLLFKLL
jgi:hypothetical protein